MPLIPGTRLGPYEIVSPIGKGGMGEVYRARDTKLERDVAIKVLPEELAQDEERRARFDREAKLLASLNHPNIASIHGFEESDGVGALVLELVEGPTLAERIEQGPIPVDEGIVIAKQIAEALEAGHEAGVIHRDLKPANIKLKEDGTVKVLDYGLAKALEGDTPGGVDSELSQSPTLTRQGTEVGVILGTAAYMSPEQAKGKRVDKRADVWAFGAVLYEMLTGKRAFEAEDVSDTLAAVLRAEPDWDALPPEVSPTLRGYLSRCLEKNPQERMRDIGDVRLAMSGAFEASAVPREDLRLSPRSKQGWMVAGAALLVGAFLGAGWWSATSDVAPRVARFVIDSPPPPSTLAEVALTPDGSNLVYRNDGAGIENDRIAVRALNALQEAHVQIDSPFPALFLSPDGEWIGYFGRGVLQKVSILGGPPVTICPLPPGEVRGASWGANDTIIFAMNWGLWRVSAGGGEPEVLLEFESFGEFLLWPDVLPNGKAVLFTSRAFHPGRDVDETDKIALLSLDSGEVKVLVSPGGHARYVPTGHIVYGTSGTVRAFGFDIDRLEVTTDPVPVLDGVLWSRSGHVAFDVSEDGSFAYITGPEVSANERTLVWVDRDGEEELLSAEPRAYTYPRISPDGSRVALDVRDEDDDVWIWDFARETLTRLTFDPAPDYYPTWTPDGSRIAFGSPRSGESFNLFWKPADGTGAPEQLTDNAIFELPQTFSPDGTQLLYGVSEENDTIDLWVRPVESGGEPTPLLATEFLELNAEISPDGRWLALQSDESGQHEIYVRTFPNVDEGRWQISRGGGSQPLWRPDGLELFYFSASGHLMSVPIETDPFTPGNPARVLERAYLRGGSVYSQGRTYDVSRDGARFLMIRETADGPGTQPTQLILVQNWTEELKRLVPVDH